MKSGRRPIAKTYFLGAELNGADLTDTILPDGAGTWSGRLGVSLPPSLTRVGFLKYNSERQGRPGRKVDKEEKKIKTHEDLVIYQKAFDAAMTIFELSKNFPPEEKYSLS